jgi:hypothetical protein
VAARNRLLGTVGAEGIRNLVLITGDTHASWVADLKTDYPDAASPVVGTEFAGTSISSGVSPLLIPVVEGSLHDPANAHIRFFDGSSGGYVRCTVKPAIWQSDYRRVATVLDPRSLGGYACLIRRGGWEPRSASGVTAAGPHKVNRTLPAPRLLTGRNVAPDAAGCHRAQCECGSDTPSDSWSSYGAGVEASSDALSSTTSVMTRPFSLRSFSRARSQCS